MAERIYPGKVRNRNNLWVLIIGISLSALLALLFYNTARHQEETNIERIQAIYSERTENVINSVFHKTDVLAAAVKLENGDITEDTFNTIAKLVYQENSGIRGIQYMPGAVVTYSYPLEGNEAVIGKNFLEIPERKKDVMLAIDTKSIALSGPYELIQGGLGVVARNPIFLTDDSGQEYFWGFSAIILDLPDALNGVGLDHLADDGYDFQLFCVNENGERLVIDGNPNLNMAEAVSGTIQVPHHEWTLAIVSERPWLSAFEALISFALGLLLTIVLWKLACLVARERAAVLAKDQFFSSISHDMRTPLNAVLGFTKLARLPGVSESEKDTYLEKIESAGNLLLALINDTLTLSKASSGKIKPRPEPCRTSELGNSILPAVAELAEREGVSFIVDTSGYRERTILIDRLNTEKIFLNLLTNAVRYTPAGGHVWVSVRDDPAGAKDADLVFVIRDDGIGMSKEFLEHVYEPFAQENRPGYESAGTGLGLAIVKQMVDLMGGSIQIDSEENKGTEVTVRLRFEEVTDVEAKPARKPELSKHEETLRGKKILLCEDNALNREIAGAMLRNQGVEIQEAVNGEIGLEIFRDSAVNEFDAVLMDLRMPVMDGLEATRRIRALDRPDAKTVPIIAMTADAFTDDVRKCLEAGMNGHLAKPVIPEKLYEILRENIAGGK